MFSKAYYLVIQQYFYRNMLFVNNGLEVNRICRPPLLPLVFRDTYGRLRPSSWSLTNYVALLWAEVGQPWSKVCTVLWRSNIVTVGSNPILKMDICLVFFCICFVLCMREASQRVSPCTKRPTEGLQIDFETPQKNGKFWAALVCLKIVC